MNFTYTATLLSKYPFFSYFQSQPWNLQFPSVYFSIESEHDFKMLALEIPSIKLHYFQIERLDRAI